MVDQSREVVNVPFLEVFRAMLDMAWSILFEWKVFLIIFKVPPKPNHSVIL